MSTSMQYLIGYAFVIAVICGVIRAMYLELARRCSGCGSRDIAPINLCECSCNACGADWRRKP